MDIHDSLDEAVALLEAGKARAFGGGAVVDRDRILHLLSKIRATLPDEIVEASTLLHHREATVAEGRREADELVARARDEAQAVLAEAHAQREQRISDHEILLEAQVRAAQVVADAQARAAGMREQVDDYAAAKLSAMAAALAKALDAVEAGRQRVGDRVGDDTVVRSY